jgi:NAD(P)-dependent dehydrogenase (short-subunit alcohol dehydrogenase family)
MDTQKFGAHLEGKVVVVTGASKGIGRGLARIIAAEGAIVALAARDTEALAEVKETILGEGGMAYVYSLDLRRVESIRSVLNALNRNWGRWMYWSTMPAWETPFLLSRSPRRIGPG